MRIFITGGRGQLGRALQEQLTDHELLATDQPEVDIVSRAVVRDAICDFGPDLVIHCAAYTDVDGCARDPELAYRVNGLGTQNVCLAAQEAGAALLHISTNEVFDGTCHQGYSEWIPPNPINAYGRSKAAAESHVGSIMARYYIVRPAWLYGPHSRNFVHAILERAAAGKELRVVADEVANPTYVFDLAEAIAQLIATRQYGIYHLTNEGACSRWQFAAEILRLGGYEKISNEPILSRHYRRDSKPPQYSALLNVSAAAIGIKLRPWQEALECYLSDFTSK